MGKEEEEKKKERIKMRRMKEGNTRQSITYVFRRISM
jgi:hypothetical protein